MILLILIIANFGKVSATAHVVKFVFLFYLIVSIIRVFLFPVVLNSAPQYAIKREKEQEMAVNECFSYLPVCL
jgi:hypothetical protein